MEALSLYTHSVSLLRERKISGKTAEEKKIKEHAFIEEQNVGTTQLMTPITADKADHSFNGIIFDIKVKDAHEVEIMSISIAGMLGRVRIYARNSRWEKGVPEDYEDNYWGHHQGVGSDGWTLVADQQCHPSWDRPLEIRFNEPFLLRPHSRHAFYCHSGLPDDLGIQYQSCRRDQITVQDDHVAILPGLGHCGSTPFGNRYTDGGWYRHYRTIAGHVRYRSRLKGWNMREHSIFPEGMRRAVFAMMAAQKVVPRSIPYSASAPVSPHTVSSDAPNKPPITRSVSAPEAASSFSREGGEENDETMNIMFGEDEEAETNSDVQLKSPFTHPQAVRTEGALGLLNDRFIVLRIMEYCHYDWFREAETTTKRR